MINSWAATDFIKTDLYVNVIIITVFLNSVEDLSHLSFDSNTSTWALYSHFTDL